MLTCSSWWAHRRLHGERERARVSLLPRIVSETSTQLLTLFPVSARSGEEEGAESAAASAAALLALGCCSAPPDSSLPDCSPAQRRQQGLLQHARSLGFLHLVQMCSLQPQSASFRAVTHTRVLARCVSGGLCGCCPALAPQHPISEPKRPLF